MIGVEVIDGFDTIGFDINGKNAGRRGEVMELYLVSSLINNALVSRLTEYLGLNSCQLIK